MRHVIFRLLAAIAPAVLAGGAAHAQQWVERYDRLSFDQAQPVWCNAERSACAISRQPYGASGALRIALTVAGTPDCRVRRPRYVIVKRNGEKAGDLSRVQEVLGNTCLLDVPMTQIDGTRLLQFSVPMLTQDSVNVDLPLDGLDIDKLSANRP